MSRFVIYRHLMIVMFLSVTISGIPQTQYSLRQYLNARIVFVPTCSPDGKEVAFKTDITGELQLWRLSTEGGWPHQLTFFPSGVAWVRWSPTGNDILISADIEGNQQYQLYLVRSDGNQVTELTANPKVRYMLGGWSDDGKQIFYTSNARDERYFDCYIMDLESKSKRMIFQKDAVLHAAALSPDGRFLAAIETLSEVNADMHIADIAKGRSWCITPHQGDAKYEVIGFNKDGQQLYVLSDQEREFVNLAQINTQTGELAFLQDEPADMNNALLSPDGSHLAFTINRDGYEELVLWDTFSHHPIHLPAFPRGISYPSSFSSDNRRLFITFNASSVIDDIWVIDIPAVQAKQITFSSYGGVDKSLLVDPSLIHYQSFDGLKIPAFLYLPKNVAKDKSVPVILSVHGGPEEQEQPYFYPYYQYFISRGYAILTPNIRGSRGYGKRYLALDNGAKRWDALKDLLAATDWIASHPSLNPNKVAIMGFSYGGFAVLAMLAHYPDRFAAGIDIYGPADLKTFLANTAPYRRPNRIAEYGDPVRDSAFLDAISPAQHADKIKAPLLAIQGANDPIVPPSESEQIVELIEATGSIAEYMLLPDEGHGLRNLENRIKVFEAIVEFLDEHVQNK